MEGLARLRTSAESGELDALCRRHRVRVLTVFGSAARGEPGARDLDIDVVLLDAGGPVIRERALVGSVVLDESEPGAWASAATAAMLERIDTEWLRRLDLELLADR